MFFLCVCVCVDKTLHTSQSAWCCGWGPTLALIGHAKYVCMCAVDISGGDRCFGLFIVAGDYQKVGYDNLQAAASAADLQNPMSVFFDGSRLEMGVLVHPQSGLVVVQPRRFFVRKT